MGTILWDLPGMSTPPLLTAVKRPLAELFRAVNHEKREFSDLASMDVLANCRREQFTKARTVRHILAPNDRLAACLDFIRLFVVEFLPINEDVVYSYRKGVSTFDAVARHKQGKYFFVCDIASFFPSLGHKRVEVTLAQGGDRTPISDFDHWQSRFCELICPESGLPMGFPTSPGISNAALKPFDDALKAACDMRGLVFTRYSDDITISGDCKEALQGIDKLVENTLNAVFPGEFRLNQSKSKLMNLGMKVKLLGMVLLPDGSVSVDGPFKKDIEVLLHFHSKDRRRFLEKVENDLQRGERKLAGMINYVNTVDQDYLDKLRRKFGAAAVDYFLHRSFS
ncbi:reverse transcriptase domain-containing protein [Roseateles sp. DB2]|uniref:reverse transcriptase domain-containing protein n=1 Tax=Roseateles sp. DB2 TaxID=3453717 RepID=UPI003EEA239F